MCVIKNDSAKEKHTYIINNYELYLITDQRGEHNGTPLHKTMFYRKLIQFKQAGAPSRYGPRSKYRLRLCSRALVGAAEDWTQASCMRDKDLSIELLLLLLFAIVFLPLYTLQNCVRGWMCKGGCQKVQDDFYHFNIKLYFACVRATFSVAKIPKRIV